MIRVYEFVKRVGTTREELAKRLGVGEGTLKAWNYGDRKPTYDMCMALLESGMTVEELFGYPYPSTASPKSEMKELAKELLEEIREELRNER